jgi:drug/metabolite transporter (DMT)-like permease
MTEPTSPSSIPLARLDVWGTLLVLMSALGFGFLGIFTKFAYAQGIDPLSVQVWKIGGAALVLWIWVLLRREMVWRREGVIAFSIGAMLYVLQSLCLFGALFYATVGLAVLLFYTYPAFVALLNWAITRKPLNQWQSIALGLSLAGCLMTVDWVHQEAQLLGIVLGLGAGVSYALYLTTNTRLVLQGLPSTTSAAFILSGAATTVTGIAFLHQGVMVPHSGTAVYALAGLAIVATALPTALLYTGLQRLDIVSVAVLSTMEPISAIVMSILILGEPVGLGQVLGGSLILGSAILLHLPSDRS